MAAEKPDSGQDEGSSRRDFLYVATAGVSVVGVGLAAWPFVDTMNPSADVLALSSIELDLSPIEVGQSITVMWRKQPVFVRRRTAEEIAAAQADDGAELPDPQTDAERAPNPEWLIMVGVCTHLGCVPQGQGATDPKGEYGGWICPCHGSHYDTSGRIRKGPAPKNLAVPKYEFIDDSIVRIG